MAEPAPSVVLDAMLAALTPFVPTQVPGLPIPSLTVAKAEIRPAGIGNYIGTSPHGSIATIERQATRVKAVARFSVWGYAVADVEDGVTALNAAIFEKRAELAAHGFLKLSFDGSVPSEQTKDAAAWRRFADYDLLYEHEYEDEDGTAGLIFPIASQDAPTGAKWSTTADFGRWDDVAAPPVNLRGPAIFTELAALTFIAGMVPTGVVTITRTFDGALAPTDAGDLATFIAQTTATPAPERNVFVSFPSLAALLAAFAPDGTPISLDRDLNNVPETYVPTHLVFPAPLVLEGVADRLELTYAGPKLDQTAVVYLRAIRKEAST